VNGRIGQFEFHVSVDGVNWGSPVSTGTFANDATEKEVLISRTTGRYVRLVALTEANGNPWTSMAELNVLGALVAGSNSAPSITSTPLTTAIQDTPYSYDVNATDPDAGDSLTYSLTVAPVGMTIDAQTGLISWTPSNAQVGANPVTVSVADNGSPVLSVSQNFTVTVEVTVASPIPQAGWTLVSVDSEETIQEDGAGINAIDGNPATMWHTEWGLADPPPPHEIQIDLGAVYEVSGFRYLPRQDGIVNGRIGQFEFYVSVDGVNWGSPVSEGTFANDATEKDVLISRTTGRYVRLVALTEANGNPWTSMAELNVLGALVVGSNSAPLISTAPVTSATDAGHRFYL
jgi:regulator of extracellular matrix RemA (YlzA/DUF370 family)